MASLEIVKRLEIDAGHRLMKHEGKCRHVHGHRYAFEIHVRGPELDEVGRIVDFSVIKELVGGWLDENWDHGFILQDGDPLDAVLTKMDSKLYVMEVAPTAENLAREVMGICRGKDYLGPALKEKGVEVIKVVVYETPTSRAECAV